MLQSESIHERYLSAHKDAAMKLFVQMETHEKYFLSVGITPVRVHCQGKMFLLSLIYHVKPAQLTRSQRVLKKTRIIDQAPRKVILLKHFLTRVARLNLFLSLYSHCKFLPQSSKIKKNYNLKLKDTQRDIFG